MYTPNWLLLQNLNFELGALRYEKRRDLAFYTGTSFKIVFLFLGPIYLTNGIFISKYVFFFFMGPDL